MQKLDYNLLDTPDRCVMVTSRLDWRTHKMQQRRIPFSGTYYWIPINEKIQPQDDWQLLSFPDQWYLGPNVMATIVAEMIDILAHRWQKNPAEFTYKLKDHIASLPQGRVDRISSRSWRLTTNDMNFIDPRLHLMMQSFNLNTKETNIVQNQKPKLDEKQLAQLIQIIKETKELRTDEQEIEHKEYSNCEK